MPKKQASSSTQIREAFKERGREWKTEDKQKYIDAGEGGSWQYSSNGGHPLDNIDRKKEEEQ